MTMTMCESDTFFFGCENNIKFGARTLIYWQNFLRKRNYFWCENDILAAKVWCENVTFWCENVTFWYENVIILVREHYFFSLIDLVRKRRNLVRNRDLAISSDLLLYLFVAMLVISLNWKWQLISSNKCWIYHFQISVSGWN